MNSDSVFPEPTVGYESRNPFVRNLFWKRIETAVGLVRIDNQSVVLDLGCQKGHLLETIRKSNLQCECWGIDIETKIMGLKILNCNFKVGDARSIPFPDEYFSIVFVLDVLEHIDEITELEVAIGEIQRVLKPAGQVVLSGPTESVFYRLCRLIQFKSLKVDYHFHSIYDLERLFVTGGLQKLKVECLPPLLPLFRVTAFRKQLSFQP